MLQHLPPIKLVTLGEGRVGKSSLLLRFTADGFDPDNPSTLAASFIEKRVVIGTQPITLNLWDTAGQECFHALGPLYYRDADGALLVFDLSDRDSFDKVKRWIAELRTMVSADLPICLAGNKSDLSANVLVEGLNEEAEQYAESLPGVKYFSTSALLNRNVDVCFLYLANEAVKRQAKLAQEEEGDGEEAVQPRLRLGRDERVKREEESACCV